MTSPHTPDPTGATGPRPDAARRTDLPAAPVSEHREGGLLRVGTRVRVTIVTATTAAGQVTGVIADTASVPAPYLSIDRDDRFGRVVVFTGPGVIVEPAPPAHPGLG